MSCMPLSGFEKVHILVESAGTNSWAWSLLRDGKWVLNNRKVSCYHCNANSILKLTGVASKPATQCLGIPLVLLKEVCMLECEVRPEITAPRRVSRWCSETQVSELCVLETKDITFSLTVYHIWIALGQVSWD